MVRRTDRPTMTIAVDLGGRARKEPNLCPKPVTYHDNYGYNESMLSLLYFFLRLLHIG